ncbi:cytochrome b [Methylobacterium sp. C25]|uniref:cytochrome b n=1 Tax=Methylobacterium sp. C25 TaxID=2721622 RepID=UPI001F423CF8|nr:cytochrome b [Methylobacterium sp. C25]MCE4226625.1 cytochrome b [Methylobacterium sp. C25]
MSETMGSGWFDTPQRYGRISRAFHWCMAAFFGWQFAGALLFVSIGDKAITRLVGGSHFTMGFMLFVLVLLRCVWGLLNLRRRPAHPGRLGRAAVAGHVLLYALMVVVPSLAMLRQYGSGKGFSLFGVELMAARDYKIEWMMVPGDLLHYWLGFLLLASILGHVTMSVVHRRSRHDDVFERMI